MFSINPINASSLPEKTLCLTFDDGPTVYFRAPWGCWSKEVADILDAKKNNLTYEAIKILIPRLKAHGYAFISLDQI